MLTTETATPETSIAYTPGALLNAVGNSLTSPLLNKVFKAKGVYRPGKGVNYNGAYYDNLKDEFSDSNLVLVVPERIRPQLRDGQLIEASVYLSKRFQGSTGRVDLLLTLNELLARKEKVIDEEATKALALLQNKAKAGYKDADSLIKRSLFEQKPIRVTILVGLGAIVDQDIKHQVREAAVAYEFRYIRINLSQAAEITQALITQQNTDILVIARGGGENMSIFDNPAISEAALRLHCIFITALGHSTDEPLLQKIADKSFITPTALGQYFHDLYNKTLDDLNHSKAKLIADLSKQIELNYQHKLQDLQKQLVETTRTAQDVARRAEQAEQETRQLSDRLARTKAVIAVLATLATLITLIVLYFIFKSK
jgi:exodeoxyribonuclease VII large subunit